MYYPPAGSAPLPPAPAPMSSDTSAPAAPAMDPETAAQFRNYGYGSVPQRGGHHARGSAGHQHGHQAFRHAGHPGNAATPPPLPPSSAGLPPPPPSAAGFPGHPQAYPPPPLPQHYPNQASPSTVGPPAKRARYDQQHQQMHPGQSMAQPMQMQPSPAQPQQQQHAAPGVYYPQHAYPATHHLYPAPPLPQHPQMQHGQPQVHHPQHHQQQPQQAFYPGPAAVGSGHATPMSQAVPMQQQPPQAVLNQGYPGSSGPIMTGHPTYNAGQHNVHHQHPQHSAMPPPLALPPMKAHRAPAGKPVIQAPPPPPLPPPSLAPPPPPPPPPSSNTSKHTTGTIRLDSKGAATLPPTPVGAAVYAGTATSASTSTLPQASSQPRDDGPRRRDTRPIPASSAASANGGGPSRHTDDYRRDLPRERDRDRDSRDSRDGSSRGGGRGRGSLRGGRGGSVDSRRSYESRYPPSDNGSANHRTGGKRSFSQTGPGPSPSSADRPSNKHGRARADSNATITSVTYSNAPKQGKGKRDRERESSTRPGSVAGDIPLGPKGKKGSANTANDAASNPLKKTLTDFRIESLEIRELGWMWTAKQPEKDLEVPKAAEEVDPSTDNAKDPPEDIAQEIDLPDAISLPTVDEAQTSTNLQRVDSRKEKRKHEDDEDDVASHELEGLGDPAAETDRYDRERGGKKVKAEALNEEPVSTKTETGHGQIVGDLTSAEKQEAHEDATPAADNAQTESATQEDAPPFAFTVEGQRPRRQSASASDTSDAEVAAAVIARPSSSPGKLPSADPESEPVLEVTPAKSNEPEVVVPRISRTLPVTHASQPKENHSLVDGLDTANSKGKNRENSRLRIYFSSPVALESKEGRKHLLSRSTTTNASPGGSGRNKRVKRELPAEEEERLPRNVREASMESRVTQVDDKASEVTDQASDQEDDVDGVPISNEDAVAEEPAQAAIDEEADKAQPPKEEEIGDAQAEEKPSSVDETLPEPSPDRISISYAKNSRRLVIDANVVEEVCVHRAEAKIEIKIKLEAIAGHKASSLRYCQGVFLETLKHGNKFTEVDRQMLESEWPTDDAAAVPPPQPDQKSDADANSDQLLPPLHHLFSSLSLTQPSEGAQQKAVDAASVVKADQPEGSEASASKEVIEPKESSSASESSSPFRYNTITIVARLDRANPLTEAKWVRTGSPDDWIMSVVGTSLQLPKGTLFGPSPNTVPPVSAWKGKIKVADPDAPPTFQHALENWLSTRSGFEDLRYSFVATHFQDVRNVLEVLLRLIRGPGNSNNSHAHHQQHQPAGSVAAQAVASEAPYPDQQTPISLAAFQLFKMGIEAAQEAGVPKAEIDRKIGEVVRNLPYSMIYRSLDSMYVDYKRSKTR